MLLHYLIAVTSFPVVAVTASEHGDSRPSPFAILPSGLTASLLLIPLTPYKVAIIDREDSIRGDRGCRGASNSTFHQQALKNKSPPNRTHWSLDSFKLAERCCLKNQWGSNVRNIPVDSSKVYRFYEQRPHHFDTIITGNCLAFW